MLIIHIRYIQETIYPFLNYIFGHLLFKIDYQERPDIDEVINKIKKIKEFIKTENYKDLDNISLNILK